MIVGLALDAQGWPLCCHMWPGNTTDVKTLIPAVKDLSNRKGNQFFIDEKKIQADEKFDGLWVLETNMDLEAEVVAFAYKQLWMVEDLFRTMKSILETRPIFHKCDENIRGHVFYSFLALILRRELERRLEARKISFEWSEIIRGLDQLHEVEVSLRGKRFLLRSRLLGQANQACLAAGIRLPPPAKPIL